MNISKRLERLEKASMLKNKGNEFSHIAHLSPAERSEKIKYLADKMTEEEIAAFEEKHRLTEGYIKSILTSASSCR